MPPARRRRPRTFASSYGSTIPQPGTPPGRSNGGAPPGAAVGVVTVQPGPDRGPAVGAKARHGVSAADRDVRHLALGQDPPGQAALGQRDGVQFQSSWPGSANDHGCRRGVPTTAERCQLKPKVTGRSALYCPVECSQKCCPEQLRTPGLKVTQLLCVWPRRPDISLDPATPGCRTGPDISSTCGRLPG